MEFLSLFPVTTALIAANLAASLLAFANRDFYAQNLFQVGAVLKNKEYYRIITSGFLHVNFFHLAINMFVLFQFGAFLEVTIGIAGYMFVYFAALIGASVWMLLDKKDEPTYSAVGASGAISGILLAYCLFRPFDTLYLFGILPMWAIVFAIGYIVLSAVLSNRENAIIAHGAHLGGAVVGLVATLIWVPEAGGRFLQQIQGIIG